MPARLSTEKLCSGSAECLCLPLLERVLSTGIVPVAAVIGQHSSGAQDTLHRLLPQLRFRGT